MQRYASFIYRKLPNVCDTNLKRCEQLMGSNNTYRLVAHYTVLE